MDSKGKDEKQIKESRYDTSMSLVVTIVSVEARHGGLCFVNQARPWQIGELPAEGPIVGEQQNAGWPRRTISNGHGSNEVRSLTTNT